MAGYRYSPETGEREYVSEDAPPAEPPASKGPPMLPPGWVEMFLGPNNDTPFRVTIRPPGGRRRGYRRKSLRR